MSKKEVIYQKNGGLKKEKKRWRDHPTARAEVIAAAGREATAEAGKAIAFS